MLLHAIFITFITIYLYILPINAYAESYWTEWQQLQDTAYNGIYFSHKSECKSGDENKCNLLWSLKSKYNQSVNVTYKITYVSPSGSKAVHTGTVDLKEGENELPEFRVIGKDLLGVSVGINGFNDVKTKVREEKRQQEAEARRVAEEQRIAQERWALLSAAAAQPWQPGEAAEVTNLRNENYRQLLVQQEQEQREERRRVEERQQREEDRRQERAEKRRYNEQLSNDKASAYATYSQPDLISQALQNQNRQFDAIREQNRQREEQQRREKADREREAREEQQRRSESAANQQREAEYRRQQQQVAFERSQREDQERQQRQRDDQQRVAQLEADKQRQQQKKQLSCTNMTPAVSGTIKRLKGAGHCDGELAAYLTNNSGIKVTCEQKFERNGVLPGSGAGAQVHIQPGETVGGESGGLWECGHADSDSYKYYCIPADEPYECMRKF